MIVPLAVFYSEIDGNKRANRHSSLCDHNPLWHLLQDVNRTRQVSNATEMSQNVRILSSSQVYHYEYN
jgi:hypothetical protein